MNGIRCDKCGSKVLIRNYISARCPVCGKYFFASETGRSGTEQSTAELSDAGPLWNEHRLGLMLKRDGWRWMEVLSPPRWFVEEIV